MSWSLASCEPRVPGDHLYKIYWLPSPLEWGYRWRIVLTVSLMSPQYGTIRGLSLVTQGQWSALIGWYYLYIEELDDITTPETSNNNTICSQHFNGGLAIHWIYVLPQMTLTFILYQGRKVCQASWFQLRLYFIIAEITWSSSSLMWNAEMQQMAWQDLIRWSSYMRDYVKWVNSPSIKTLIIYFVLLSTSFY